MKIAFLTSSYPRFPGDIAGTFVRDIALEVARRGHEVHVLMPSDGKRQQHVPSDGVFEHPVPYAPLSRLRVLGYAKSLQADRRLNRLAYAMILPYVVSSFAKLRAVVRAYHCDAIHAHWVLPNGPTAAAVSRRLGVPLVISLHGSDVYVAERHPAFSLAARWAFRSADVVTACSENLQDRSIRLGSAPDRTVVIPYGASVQRFASEGNRAAALARRAIGISDNTPLVFALGRLVHKKGFDVLMSAWPRVLEKFPEAYLALGGEGPLATELESTMQSLGIAHRARLLGRVASTDVPSYMGACDVFVMPSVTDLTGNVDGLPVVVLEAMAAGRPVVATRVGGMPEVIENGVNGILVEERSPEALAAGLVQLLTSPNEARACGERARALVEARLSWSHVARQFENTYEQAGSHRLKIRGI